MIEDEKSSIIKTAENVVPGRPGRQFEAFCSGCKKLSEMASPKIAGTLSGVTEHEVLRLIKSEMIHFAESDRVVVCLDSLRAAMNKTDGQFMANTDLTIPKVNGGQT
jgi:hypothetical protein